jgi:outer membrane protein OmpA-like peptidoglycan-associated protein
MIGNAMNKTLLSLLCACLVPLAHAGNRPPAADDLAVIEQMQRRADRLGFGKVDADDYALSKARAWLDLALDEYHEKDRTGIVQDAAAEALILLQALESGEVFDAGATPHPYASERVRPDLWAKAESMKRHAEFSCGARRIAELEVQLVWTGHEKWESGWMHAEPYARIAENLAYEAQLAIDACAASKAMRAPEPAAAGPALPAEPLVIAHHTLATDALFEFGRHEVDHLVAGARQKLDALADQLLSWKTLEQIDIVGHTDRLGADDRNQALSERRAEAVKSHLVGRGLPAGIIHASGAGSSRPLVHCDEVPSLQARVECLQPNRRVELTIQGSLK